MATDRVLQAGSAATVSGNNVVYWVWTEWFPIGAIQITNFPIKPGDYLTVLSLCAAARPRLLFHAEQNN